MLFALEWRFMLEQTSNIDFWQDMVKELIIQDEKVVGVKTSMGIDFKAAAVILTNGTFLNGVIHIGEKKFGGGRTGEKAASGLTEQLVSIGFENGRMKTGTPPRIDGRSLDYSKMEEQLGDENPGKFSFTDTSRLTKQRSCHIAYTNENVHDVLKEGFDKSPMFAGRISGVGPRYCPSIEDKINRFADKIRHQLFVEPEGWNTVEVYLNGFSTSLPDDIQQKALRLIPGFENVKLFRPGYAIEYDYFPPQQLHATLETKNIGNLYFAGQINGTTGYEEAAGQGIIAGINAHQKINEKDPFILKRSEAYIGVLIDDLITKGTDEPYRMFTSRAEFRSLLRQDNADIRLTPLSYKLGLAKQERLDLVKNKIESIENILLFIKNFSVHPENINSILGGLDTEPIKQKQKLHNLLLRPQISIFDLLPAIPELNRFFDDLLPYDKEELGKQIETNIKYEGYIQKEYDIAERIERYDNLFLKEDFNYSALTSLSMEARQKLSKVKPRTLGQAARISGISPSDVSILMIYLSK